MSPLTCSPLLPHNLGALHFCGIGGYGMSSLAELLHGMGFPVQGSDVQESSNVKHLRGLGIDITIGHDAKNIYQPDGSLVSGLVFSAAIQPDNVELLAATQNDVPLINRAELLGEVMKRKWAIGITGTHGKTTTTSLVDCLLQAGNLDPTMINGGVVNSYGSSTHVGRGDWLVAEADEAFGSFLKMYPTVAVVTNIDPEHLDHYKTFDVAKAAYREFVDRIPFYGFGVMCLDHKEVQNLIAQCAHKRIYTYGTSPQADVQARNIKATPQGSYFDLYLSGFVTGGEPQIIKQFMVPVPGVHNVLNSLAAITVAYKLGVDLEAMRQALAQFGGVKRRFTKTGVAHGVTVIDDYGHHPVEIAAVLKAARGTLDPNLPNAKVVAVVQPHRYSRVVELFDEFCTCLNDSDIAIMADVYAAGETPIDGCRQADLVAGIEKHGHQHVIALENPDDLASLVAPHVSAGDIVVCMGAGNITQWAYALPAQLEVLLGAHNVVNG